MKSLAFKSIVLIALAVVVIAIPMWPQTPAASKPQFEVASIKTMNPPVTQIGIQNANGRFVATGFSLKMLVGRGFAVPESRVIGGPNWAGSDRFEIDARAPAGTPPPPLQPNASKASMTSGFIACSSDRLRAK
jgi:hypothetical protein